MTKLLLDTHVLIWLLTGNRAPVSSAAVAAISEQRNQVAVSAVSVWEIAIKRSRGKLRLPDGWDQAINRLDFDAMPITALHAAHVEQLPWHHRDPFDRILIAQAQLEDRMLVTADSKLAAYGVPIVW